MVSEDPKVARLSDRVVGRFRNVVGVGQSRFNAWIEQLGQLVAVETEQFAIETNLLQFADFQWKQVVVPLGIFAGSIVGDPIRFHGLRLKVRCNVDRHLGKVQLLGSFPSRMANNDDAVGIDHDRLTETELVDGLDDRSNRIVIDSRIVFVRLSNFAAAPRRADQATTRDGVAHIDTVTCISDSPSKASRETEGFGRSVVSAVFGWLVS